MMNHHKNFLLFSLLVLLLLFQLIIVANGDQQQQLQYNTDITDTVANKKKSNNNNNDDDKEKTNNNNNNNNKGIQIIGAGLGRTGTYSVKTALEQLGYKVYHYIDLDNHSQSWIDYINGKISVDDIIDIIINDGYNATIENPTCDIYTNLIDRFPNAKVILTVRDTSNKFENSWKTLFNTMIITEYDFSLFDPYFFPSIFQYIPLFQHLKQLRCFMGTTHLGLEKCELTNTGWRDKSNNGWIAKQYDNHNQHVINTMKQKQKEDQLLIFNVKQGWGPLCNFLFNNKNDNNEGSSLCPNKNEPFPTSKGVNDAQSLKQLRTYFLIAVYGWFPILIILLFALYQIMKKLVLIVGGNSSISSAKSNNINKLKSN